MKNSTFVFIILTLCSSLVSAFEWPSTGKVTIGFDSVKNRGIDIDGVVGDPIYASESGTVAYAGSGLSGYGNIIFIKHEGRQVTAYAHLSAFNVIELQSVIKGQKIGEMGNTGTNRVKLHFRMNINGNAIDPISLLPQR